MKSILKKLSAAEEYVSEFTVWPVAKKTISEVIDMTFEKYSQYMEQYGGEKAIELFYVMMEELKDTVGMLMQGGMAMEQQIPGLSCGTEISYDGSSYIAIIIENSEFSKGSHKHIIRNCDQRMLNNTTEDILRYGLYDYRGYDLRGMVKKLILEACGRAIKESNGINGGNLKHIMQFVDDNSGEMAYTISGRCCTYNIIPDHWRGSLDEAFQHIEQADRDPKFKEEKQQKKKEYDSMYSNSIMDKKINTFLKLASLYKK